VPTFLIEPYFCLSWRAKDWFLTKSDSSGLQIVFGDESET